MNLFLSSLVINLPRYRKLPTVRILVAVLLNGKMPKRKRLQKRALNLLQTIAGLLVALTHHWEPTFLKWHSVNSSKYTCSCQSKIRIPAHQIKRQLESVLTDSVCSQLGGKSKWNGTGVFIINGNQTNLDAKVSSAPYADNKTKMVQWRFQQLPMPCLPNRPANINRVKKREMVSWVPAGWHQVKTSIRWL